MKLQILAWAMLVALSGHAAAQAPGEQAPPEQAPPVQTPGPATTDSVYEAVVRYQIGSWQIGAVAYCIRINGRDADDKFLRRLKSSSVKAASDCQEKQTKAGPMVIIDKHSKKKAVIFGVGEITWRNDTQADVQGGYLCGSQCMSGGIYHVVWDGNLWKVAKYDVYLSE